MIYRTNGTSVKALSPGDVFGQTWEQQIAGSVAADIAPRLLYDFVPFVRRAVTLRSNACASVPTSLMRGGRDVTERPEFSGLMGQWKSLIWRTEFAMALSPYGAYWRKATNKIGANPTPEWLLPSYVWPFLTAEVGLKYLRYVHPIGVPNAGTVELLPPEDVVRFWYPSLDRASWPGAPPGVAAQPAGAALNAQDTFIAQYFRRGAIKAVLLQVPPDSLPADRDRLTHWWNSLVAGARNAWRSIVVPTSVTPQVIGDGLKDLESDSLTRMYRQDIAAAFNIPETMLMQGAANYATSMNDRISFYEETIFPELDIIIGALNEQWLRPAYGAEIVAHPEQTEARQSAQLQQAEAITTLVGQPVMTIDEGRAWLGWEPLPKDAETPAEAAEEETDTAEIDAAEDEAEAIEDEEDEEQPTKRYAHAIPTGRFTTLPGASARKAERTSLFSSHAATRAQANERHAAERKQARERHIGERTTAADARTRLVLVQRQHGDTKLINQRHSAERGVIHALHTAERTRMLERHAAQRGVEIAEMRDRGAVKHAAKTISDDFDLMTREWSDFDAAEDAAEDWAEDAADEVKFHGQPRDSRGRFAGGGGGQRKAERSELRDKHKSERDSLRDKQRKEKAGGPRRDTERTQRHAAERAEMRERHASDRTSLRDRHQGEREQIARGADARRVEIQEPARVERPEPKTIREKADRYEELRTRYQAIDRRLNPYIDDPDSDLTGEARQIAQHELEDLSREIRSTGKIFHTPDITTPPRVPVLNGSDKQVAWANKLRAERRDELRSENGNTRAFDAYLRVKHPNLSYDERIAQIESLTAEYQSAIDRVFQRSESRFWINSNAGDIAWFMERQAEREIPGRTTYKSAPALTLAEAALAAAIQPILDTYGEAAVSAVLAGEAFDAAPMGAALRAAILGALADAAVSAALEAAADIGVPVDEVAVASEAAEWARAYSGNLITGIDASTMEMVRVGVAAFLETPGMDRGQLEGLLSGAFSPSRAEMIATTEVTRAASQGQRIYQGQLAKAGLDFERVWRTTEQEVCPICKKLNGEPESAWAADFPDGPPAHPRCKCAITLRPVREAR